MAKKSKESDMNLFYLKNDMSQNSGQAKPKESLDEMMKRKKQKEREIRIKDNQNKKREEEFDFDTETVIKMTNKNNLKKEEEKRKVLNKKERKRKKRIKRIKFILKVFVIIGVLSGSIAFALTSPLFNIKNIYVLNNNLVSTENIISLSQLKLDNNIFKFSIYQTENKIKENPYVEKVEVNRKFPNSIEIKIEERVPTYSIKYMEKYAIINNQGYILEISDTNKELPVIYGLKTVEQEISLGQRLNNDDLERLEDGLKIMSVAKDNNLDAMVTSIDIGNKNEYSIYLEQEQKKVYLGDNSNLSNKMLYVVSIIEKEKGVAGEIYVNGDLNNKFKPYFKEKV